MRSVTERASDKGPELIVGDLVRGGGRDADGALARAELGMAVGEPGVLALAPAVERDAVLPHADVEACACPTL